MIFQLFIFPSGVPARLVKYTGTEASNFAVQNSYYTKCKISKFIHILVLAYLLTNFAYVKYLNLVDNCCIGL